MAHTSQLDLVYEAEEQAEGDYRCGNPALDVPAAQAQADEVLAWAKGTFGIRADLRVTVDEELVVATATEISAMWNEGLIPARAAEVHGPMWSGGSPTSIVTIYSAQATDTDTRICASEHLMFHELAHVVVGHWPGVMDGRFVLQPDAHGGLFTRRHLDIIERFHPTCLLELQQAYDDLDVDVADPDVEPASWWNLPRPTEDDLRLAGAR